MKKALSLIALVMVIIVSGVLFAGCSGQRIGDANFRVTKAIVESLYTAGSATEDDKTDDRFDVIVKFSIEVRIIKQDASITVQKSKFAYTSPTHAYDSWIMKGSNTGGDTDQIVVNGPTSESGSTAPKIKYVYVEYNYGNGFTNEQLTQIKNDITLSYNGTQLHLLLGIARIKLRA